MKTTTLTIRGTRPLLLHSDVSCDPLNPAAIEIARMTKRKDKKTAEAQHEIARVEWEAGLYYDDEGGVHMPTWNIIRSIQDGARMSKSGKLIERAVTAINDRAYFGLPKSLDALWADPQYRDRRSVKVGKARVIRTRPRIPTGWKLKIELAYVETMIDEATIREFASVSGALIGLGDFRQRFGRYEVV